MAPSLKAAPRDMVQQLGVGHLLTDGLVGMVFSFGAGLLALRWLSSWLEKGRWKYFGYYCLAASVGVFLLSYFKVLGPRFRSRGSSLPPSSCRS
jgi:undecaprenyl pyrophosphate phosphatase UppP